MEENVEAGRSAKKKVAPKSLTNQQIALGLGKIPPQAVDMEEAVLGALMLEKNALTAVIDILHTEAFYKEAHQKIFKVIHDLFHKAEPIDILTVTHALKKSGDLELVGGAFYITQLTNRIASAANIEYHARIILQKFIQRELIRISSETIKSAYEDTSDVLKMLDDVEKNLFSIAEGNIRRNCENMNSLITKAIREIEIASKQTQGITGVESGFTDLDRITAGWQKSDLIIVAARPGMGKTAFTLSLAANAALQFNRPVAFFSLEMSSVQLVNRLLSSQAEITSEAIRKGQLAEHQWQQLNSKIAPLSDAPIFIDDTPALSVFELRAKCRRLVAEKKVQLIIIDYMQLMVAGTDNRNGNREQEISTISRSLKAIAKELEVPIICLSQLSREVEKRGTASKRPQLSDLRESGAIEQDADMVMFIYRPEYYGMDVDDEGHSTKNTAEIIIAKNRNGSLNTVKLTFIGQYTKFKDRELENQTPQDKAIYGYTDESNKVRIPNPNVEAENRYTRGSKMNDMPDEDPF